MMQYYIFAGFIGLMLFALLFWYKRTPKARLPRKEAEQLAEKEAKLFKLYQNLEDMMDSFESYVEQQTAHIEEKAQAIATAEKQVDELAGRMQAALHQSEERWEEAASMVDKAEFLANELTGRMNRSLAELEQKQQQAVAEVDAELGEKLRTAKEETELLARRQDEIYEQQAEKYTELQARQQVDFQPMIGQQVLKQPIAGQHDAGQPVMGQPITEQPIAEQPKARALEPIVARPVEAERAQAVSAQPAQLPIGERRIQDAVQSVPPVTATPSTTDLPFTPMVNAQPANEVQAQLIKKLAEAKKNRQVKQGGQQPEGPRFEATVPEYDITADMAAEVAYAAGGDKFPIYSRPAPMQKQGDKRLSGGNEEQSRKQQVLDLYKEGMSAEEISRQLGVAKGAISFILDLQGKLQ